MAPLVNHVRISTNVLPATFPSRSRRNAFIVRATGSTFGTSFRVTTFGESHGGGVGCVVDGVPPRLKISQVS